MASVKFVPKGDVTRVETAVQNHDRTVVVTEKGFESADPGVIAALDEHPSLSRATYTSAKAAAKAGLPAPPSETPQPSAEPEANG